MEIVITNLPTKQQPSGPIEYLELSFDERCKSRRRCATLSGTDIVLSLERGTILEDGALIYDSRDRSILVKSKAEQVFLVKPRGAIEFCKLSHNLGNWHRSLQVCEDGSVLCQVDQPLREWLARNGFDFSETALGFNPNCRSHPHD